MNRKILFSSLMTIILLQSCATSKKAMDETTTFWVSGFKTEAAAGAGNMEVLNIHRGETLDDPQWENFYANIDGFRFEAGYLQKIEVKAEKLDAARVPADASSIKYTLIKVLDKQKDLRISLDGSWTLTRLNDHPLNRMVVIPRMNIDLSQKRVSGNAGCNNFTGPIQRLTTSRIELGPVASTKKMCTNKNVETEFHQALNSVSTYQINGSNVTFYDEAGKAMLTFMKDEDPVTLADLNNSWIATRINGSPINRMTPTPSMELNLTTMRVTGNDSCNNYTGIIKIVTGSELQFGPIAATEKMCRDMETANRFNRVIGKTASYQLDGSNLVIYDKYGQELLAFIKAD